MCVCVCVCVCLSLRCLSRSVFPIKEPESPVPPSVLHGLFSTLQSSGRPPVLGGKKATDSGLWSITMPRCVNGCTAVYNWCRVFGVTKYQNQTRPGHPQRPPRVVLPGLRHRSPSPQCPWSSSGHVTQHLPRLCTSHFSLSVSNTSDALQGFNTPQRPDKAHCSLRSRLSQQVCEQVSRKNSLHLALSVPNTLQREENTGGEY